MPEQTACEPLPQPVEWESVKMLALEVGVREAARRLGLSEERVKKRCTLDGWLTNPSARRIAQQAVIQRNLPVPQVSPSAAIAQEMATLGSKTKVGIARGLAKAAETIEQMDGAEVLISSQNVKAVVQSAALVHSWDKSQGIPKIRLELLGDRGSGAIVDVESQVVPQEEWS